MLSTDRRILSLALPSIVQNVTVPLLGLADLTIVGRKEWTLEAGHILSKCGWSPLEGRTLHWQVKHTFVNGHHAYDRGHIDNSHRGQHLLG